MKNKIVLTLCILSFLFLLLGCSPKEDKKISNNNPIKNEVKIKEEKENNVGKEKWTKDNTLYLLKENNVLGKDLSFSNKNFGSKIQTHSVNSYGKTNLQNAYCLELTVVYNNGKTVNNQKLMKETVFKIVKTINDNINKFDFNLALVGIHFSNISNEPEQYGNDFYIGINTIKKYFDNTRVENIGVSDSTGKSEKENFDSESFYKWIEENFTLPEDNSILTEDNSWTTISKMSIPHP